MNLTNPYDATATLRAQGNFHAFVPLLLTLLRQRPGGWPLL